MQNLILVRPNEEYINEIRAYRQEFLDTGGHSHGDSGLSKAEDVSAWISQCRSMEHKETVPNPVWVEADQFMLVHEGERRILGMINFRHYLNDYLAEYGGHIGYGVRPSEQRKGCAKAMLALCLEKCREFGLDRVLITCDTENEASRRTILSCNGKFERLAHIEDENETLERYWITLDPLAAYYNNYDENGRLTPKHGQVEFLTTMRFIERYLSPGAKVIEIGAGTGRYSRAIADMGYSVDAVELFPHNIDIFKENLKPEQKIKITQGNALDLSAFADNVFDIALLLGPLYHLYTQDDKQQALSEALRVTKHCGVVFVAYCISDVSLVLNGFQRKMFGIADYIKRGKIDPVTFDTVSVPEDVFELVRKEDIDRLANNFDVKRLHYVATDLYTNYMRDAVDAMDDEAFALYLRYHYAVCERPDMVGITHHSLDVLRKAAHMGMGTIRVCGGNSDSIWYHGSPLHLAELATGSTITRWKELAEAFSHKPAMLEYDSVNGPIRHNGEQDGFLYVIDEPLVEGLDIRKHPRSSMDDGVEWLTQRPLRLMLVEAQEETK